MVALADQGATATAEEAVRADWGVVATAEVAVTADWEAEAD